MFYRTKKEKSCTNLSTQITISITNHHDSGKVKITYSSCRFVFTNILIILKNRRVKVGEHVSLQFRLNYLEHCTPCSTHRTRVYRVPSRTDSCVDTYPFYITIY